MRILLLLAVLVMAATSIAVDRSRSSSVDRSHLAAGLDGVHAIDVVERATQRRLAAAD
ncbi:hypothetical protein [Endothiovibrio diazotrophicus]